MDFGSFGSIAGGVLGGVLGGGAAAGDAATAREAADRAYQELLNIGMPPDESKALVLQQYKQQGTLTPELEQYIQSGPAETVSEDPEIKKRQMSALNLISQRATGGLNPEDRAKFNELRSQLAKEQEAKQQQIQQQFQARGMGGSGAELAAALSASQGGANQASAEGDRLAATASQNALQAAIQSGQLGGQIRSQDLQAGTTNANIKNEMNRFNTQNQISQQSRNVAAKNQGQQFNLTNAQNLNNANVGQANQETQRQSTARVQNWQNQVDRSKIRARADEAQSEDFAKRAQDTKDRAGKTGSSLGLLAGMAFSHGGIVPGPEIVPGDARENDVIPAKLSAGEIVIPKTVVQSKNAGKHAGDYVAWLKKIQEEG